MYTSHITYYITGPVVLQTRRVSMYIIHNSEYRHVNGYDARYGLYGKE